MKRNFVLVAVALLFSTAHAVETIKPETNPATAWSREGEFLIDTNVVYVPAIGKHRDPSIAFDGANYLIVWCNLREGAEYSDIYGARIDPTGNILDSTVIAISTAAETQGSPAVAFDGTNYLVVWHDKRSSDSWDIYGTRVSQSGVVLNPSGIIISAALCEEGTPAVAFDGTNFLVVWQYDNVIAGCRVDQLGNVLDPGGFEISTTGFDQFPAVAFDGTNYLVVWQLGSMLADIYGARVTPSGVVLDPSGIAVSTAEDRQRHPAIAFDGTNYLVVWDDKRIPMSPEIFGARVDPLGNVLDTAGIHIATCTWEQEYPSVAYDGTNYLVVWQESHYEGNITRWDIYGVRVEPDGTVLNPPQIPFSTAHLDQEYPVIAFDGTNYLAVWQDERNGWLEHDIYGARIDPGGNLLDSTGIFMSIGVNNQWIPAVAFDGTNYLVVWQDKRSSDSWDIYGTRVSQSGVVLNPSGIVISAALCEEGTPAVAFDGTNYLVVWVDWRNFGHTGDIYGARVTPSGVVLDSSGVAISSEFAVVRSPSVAFDGTNYLVVWVDWRTFGHSGDIYGARVTPSGVVLDSSGIAISTVWYYERFPAVAFDGTNYLVVWDCGSYGPDIYGTRIDPNGNVLDSTGIAISTPFQNQVSPAVAFDGTNYLVVWQDNHHSDSYDIYGARVSQSGVVLDSSGVEISTAAQDQKVPTVAFDGTDYVIVWEDWGNGSESDIYGAKVNTSGVMINSFTVSSQTGDQISPTLTYGTDGQVLITYSGWAGEVDGKFYNAMRIWGKFYPFVGIEDQPIVGPVERHYNLGATILSGPLHLPKGKKCRVFDITGRVAAPDKIQPGIYFIEIDGKITQKVVKVR